MDGREIKMTADKGRGVFATKNFKRGSLMIVEKSIVDVFETTNPKVEMAEMLSEVNFKGIQFLRIANLYDGKENIHCPLTDIFFRNNYKSYPQEEISLERLKKIVQLNTFATNPPAPKNCLLFCFCSFINHSRSN